MDQKNLVDKWTAKAFIAEWFGFQYGRIHIAGFQLDKDGSCVSIQFRMNSHAKLGYLARRIPGGDEWELIPLP